MSTSEIERDRKSRIIYSPQEIKQVSEYLQLCSVIKKSGKSLYINNNFEIKLFTSNDFSTDDVLMGFSFFTNICFEKNMGLPSLTAVRELCSDTLFAIEDDLPIGFFCTKTFIDPYNRTNIYADIGGVLPEYRNQNISGLLGKLKLENEISNSPNDIIVISRTQNPMAVGAMKSFLPEGIKLAPFFTPPNLCMKESVNWVINSGKISRNNRTDTRFDAHVSFIHWGAYGKYGDGSTWENMIKNYEIDWTKNTAKLMLDYLQKNGLSLEEALTKGHAFIVAAYIPKKLESH